MTERFYLIKLLTNTSDQDGSSLAVFTDYNEALVSYHQTLATYHNASDVLYAIVKIVNMSGNTMDMEIVNHIPEPEPEPEEETTPEEEVTE